MKILRIAESLAGGIEVRVERSGRVLNYHIPEDEDQDTPVMQEIRKAANGKPVLDRDQLSAVNEKERQKARDEASKKMLSSVNDKLTQLGARNISDISEISGAKSYIKFTELQNSAKAFIDGQKA